MKNQKHSVVIVDDHSLLAQAIGSLLNSFNNFEFLYYCNNGKEFLTRLKSEKILPTIILMDVNMPVMNGVETTEKIKSQYPKIHVLALSVEEDENSIIKMLKAGAGGYLLKDANKIVLETALNEVVKNGYYHTTEVSSVLIRSLNKDVEKETALSLNERELEFVQHACSELTYKEIAEKMFLSPKTIDGYRDSVFQKLNVKNRIGMVLLAIKTGLFDAQQ